MRERDAAAGGARGAPASGSGGSELDRLLATVQRRRLLQAERTRAAGGPLAAFARAERGRPTTAPPSVAAASPAAASSLPVGERAPAGAAPAHLRKVAREPASAEGGLVREVLDVGPAVRILRVARPPGLSFRAGQAVKLGVPGVATRRSYSIASAPHEAQLEFCVELVPGGRLSSLLFRLSPGARLELAASAKGKLALQSGKRAHLMVATVTGIAPLRSLLRDALEGPAAADAAAFWILHGASHADELPYAAELAELARREPRVRYLPTVSRPGASRNQGWAGLTGRVEAHVASLARSLGGAASVAVYACGHPEMVRNVQDALQPLGYAVSAEDFG